MQCASCTSQLAKFKCFSHNYCVYIERVEAISRGRHFFAIYTLMANGLRLHTERWISSDKTMGRVNHLNLHVNFLYVYRRIDIRVHTYQLVRKWCIHKINVRVVLYPYQIHLWLWKQEHMKILYKIWIGPTRDIEKALVIPGYTLDIRIQDIYSMHTKHIYMYNWFF